MSKFVYVLLVSRSLSAGNLIPLFMLGLYLSLLCGYSDIRTYVHTSFYLLEVWRSDVIALVEFHSGWFNFQIDCALSVPNCVQLAWLRYVSLVTAITERLWKRNAHLKKSHILLFLWICGPESIGRPVSGLQTPRAPMRMLMVFNPKCSAWVCVSVRSGWHSCYFFGRNRQLYSNSAEAANSVEFVSWL